MWVVRDGVLGLGIAAVQDALHGASGLLVVHMLVLEIEGHPASINKNGLLLSAAVKVREEGGNNLDTLLASIHLFNLVLFGVVEDAFHSNGLHGPLLFKGVKILTSPREASLVRWSDVLGFLC